MDQKHVKGVALAPPSVRWIAIPLALLVSVLAACGGGGGSTSPAPSGGSPSDPGAGSATPYAADPYSLAVAAQPLSVGVELDAPRAVTRTITTAGGTLVAEGGDGTRYELEVPADALLADLEITMTPTARFTALPLHGGHAEHAWGVELEPSGTRFNQPLRLRITPPAGLDIPLGEQVAFSWQAGGQAVALAPFDPASRLIDLKLMHFSGWAMAQHQLGLSASIWRLRERLGGDAQARIESAMSERIAEIRAQGEGNAKSGAMTAEAIEIFKAQYEAEVLQPRLAAAGASCANSKLALETLLTYSRQTQLLGYPDLYADQLWPLFSQAATVCFEEEYVKCRDFHIVQDIDIAYLSSERQAQLLGAAQSPEWARWRVRAEQLVNQCHHYRLDIDSTSGNAAPGAAGWTFSEHMSGSVDLRRIGAPPFAQTMGSELLTADNYLIAYKDCLVVTGHVSVGAVFAVQDLFVLRSKTGSIDDFVLHYSPSPNASTHTVKDSCRLPPKTVLIEAFTWSNTYTVNVLSLPEFMDPVFGPTFDHWEVHQGEAVIATKLVAPRTTDSDGITYTSPTALKLIHTPGP